MFPQSPEQGHPLGMTVLHTSGLCHAEVLEADLQAKGSASRLSLFSTSLLPLLSVFSHRASLKLAGTLSSPGIGG